MGKKQNKKIYIDMNGRLGNQLFQYAFARKILMITNATIVIDFQNVFKNGIKNNSANTFIDCLKDFNVAPYITLNENGYAIKMHGSKKQKKVLKRYYFLRKISPHLSKLKLLQRYQYVMQKKGIYKEDECLIRFYKTYKSDIFIRGYFENPHYFADIKNILIKEFTPKYPEKEKNAELYKIIKSNESVCVSFRTWGEIKHDNNQYKLRNVCNKEYYEKAMELLHNRCPSAIFIIFSDDINYVKENYIFKYKTYYEDGADEVWEKLRLMYSCKHFIMSTSTFSWWAQYLSRNDNKIIIAPDKWYSDARQTYLLDDKWIKIQTN